MACTMTEEDWEQVDCSSRRLCSCLLSSLGATDIGSSSGCCCWDLSCLLRGIPTSVEVKDRSVPHDRYGDIMVEEVKVDATMRKQKFSQRLAVNVHTDNVLCLARIDDPDAVVQTKHCKYTTLVKGESHAYVPKTVVLLPQRVKVKFAREDGGFKFSRIK